MNLVCDLYEMCATFGDFMNLYQLYLWTWHMPFTIYGATNSYKRKIIEMPAGALLAIFYFLWVTLVTYNLWLWVLNIFNLV